MDNRTSVTNDRKAVIIPTYNEKENIENIARAVFGLEGEYHIIIIDDGSPDGTADIVKRLQKEFPERLFLIERQGKLGLGTAYITGFKWAIGHGYDYIFEMDADFSHFPPTGRTHTADSHLNMITLTGMKTMLRCFLTRSA